jgi:hypothetical protein
MPLTIDKYIDQANMVDIDKNELEVSIGNNSIIHTHNTLVNMAQKYHNPIWLLPTLSTLENEDKRTISGNREIYQATREAYNVFAADFVTRVEGLHVRSASS